MQKVLCICGAIWQFDPRDKDLETQLDKFLSSEAHDLNACCTDSMTQSVLTMLEAG